jgi:hypothetical protein
MAGGGREPPAYVIPRSYSDKSSLFNGLVATTRVVGEPSRPEFAQC